MTSRTALLWSAAAFVLAAQLATSADAAQPVALVPPAVTAQAPDNDGPIAGFGNRLPLRAVLSAVVPSGSAVQIEPGIDQAQVTSWQGGDSWHRSLDSALAPLDLVATYADDRVQIAHLQLPEPPAPPPIELSAWERTEIWQADANGQDMRDVALEWGRRVGIVPVFKGDYSYPVEAPLTFKGSLPDALDYLVQSYSTASPPPLIHHWKDQGNYAVQIILGNP